jgi:hypothetical protein
VVEHPCGRGVDEGEQRGGQGRLGAGRVGGRDRRRQDLLVVDQPPDRGEGTAALLAGVLGVVELGVQRIVDARRLLVA